MSALATVRVLRPCGAGTDESGNALKLQPSDKLIELDARKARALALTGSLEIVSEEKLAEIEDAKTAEIKKLKADKTKLNKQVKELQAKLKAATTSDDEEKELVNN